MEQTARSPLALVEGISGKAAYGKDGTKITINMLDLYLSERVKELTEGLQTPTTTKPHTVPGFSSCGEKMTVLGLYFGRALTASFQRFALECIPGRGLDFYFGPCPRLLVPTLRVGIHTRTLRVRVPPRHGQNKNQPPRTLCVRLPPMHGRNKSQTQDDVSFLYINRLYSKAGISWRRLG